MDDRPPLQKIAISGPTLASLIQRFSTSPSSLDGLLFGHVTLLTPLNLSDDPSTASSATTTSDESTSSATLVATVTGFISSPSPTSTFYDSTGTVTQTSLRNLLNNHHHHNNHHLIGWFSARRKTPLRPSMREFSVTQSLSSLSAFSSQIQNSSNPNSTSSSTASSSSSFSPCIFILLSSPFSNDHIHTHEYRAYQLRASSSFEPKLIDIVNIGPAFRGHYGSFSPNAAFPVLECDLGMSSMNEDRDGNADKEDERLSVMKEKAKDQRELDGCAEGFEVGRLSRMMGSEARSYTSNLEDLYEKMLAKVENLTRLVEQSNAKVLEQTFFSGFRVVHIAEQKAYVYCAI
ncbi:hypothetical protein AHAS_Ahas12G0189800 [Arachis hypogaea]